MFNRFLRLFKSQSKIAHVTIFGNHSPDWMAALLPDAPVWNSIRTTRDILINHVSESESSLLNEIKTNSVVIPLMETHIISCMQGPSKQHAMLIPTHQALEVLRNKDAFAQYVLQHQLEPYCPKTYREVSDVQFPCVLKRTDLCAGSGISIVSSSNHLEELLTQESWREKSWILQQYISGLQEYVVHCVAKNGNLIWHCAYQYELDATDPIKRGILPAKKTSISRGDLKQIERFLRPLKYSGPCNIDFKYTTQGQISVFEINPRLGGSLMQPANVADLQSALLCILDSAS